MKNRLWMILAPLLLAWPALAAGPAALDVSADDLTAAGADGVVAVSPAGGRFAPPVKYFRSPETLSAADAKKDCSDCADLIAVYAAEVPAAPNWSEVPAQQFVRVGGRLQLRAYIKEKKRVVTVTAVSETTVKKISAYLVAKFSK
jgi:hypothetical protein